MSFRYRVKTINNLLSVEDVKTDYLLYLNLFNTDLNNWRTLYFFSILNNARMLVTARNIEEYDRRVSKIPIQSDFQYVEVGAGLGGFVPHIIEKQKADYKNNYLPAIIIDPINYEILRDLLVYSDGLELNVKQHLRIKTLKSRCDLFLNKNKVNLVNAKLSDAVKDKKLQNIADFVVDNFGPSNHTCTEYAFSKRNMASDEFDASEKFVYELEKRLLKPSGKVISHYADL